MLDAQRGESVVHTTELSYFSRLAEAEEFGRLAWVETHRRGTETAHQVCGVTDGAEWEQGFIDLHREDAIRILDFSHAAEYVAKAGQAVMGAGTPLFQEWFKNTLHELKHGQPEGVLTTLRDMQAEVSARGPGSEAAVETIQKSLAYLEKRREHIDYAHFQALGYPIGSGSVESANKLVVEARLKGAGMHWARPHVDPMVALRNIACSDRWEEAWPQIGRQLRQQATQRAAVRRQQRKTRCLELPSLTEPTAVVEKTDTASMTTPPPTLPTNFPAPVTASTPPPKGPYRPAANHPWRLYPIGKAKYQPAKSKRSAKL